jgi:hypothetical protein
MRYLPHWRHQHGTFAYLRLKCFSMSAIQDVLRAQKQASFLDKKRVPGIRSNGWMWVIGSTPFFSALVLASPVCAKRAAYYEIVMPDLAGNATRDIGDQKTEQF